ncbi:hypothetical protein Pla175_14130 [Pirellulimonas nuda]|uniref:AAA+ ATPase domain-containing protein n=1 Tax=Pirellulimonas nuda TaxID=2528009 RepID=A0A518D994_9BACT|nr:hypothetical protein [Pirellulimonas nuda]QDU88043.1 hypothetical protein Pla175_14130 [Pirellulimonas nuda]
MHCVEDIGSLVPEEVAVLGAAAQNRGVIEIALKSDTRGRAVRAGTVKLFDREDPGYSKRCCDAVPRLVELQLLSASAVPNRFELTNFGWQFSRKACAERPDDQAEGRPDQALAESMTVPRPTPARRPAPTQEPVATPTPQASPEAAPEQHPEQNLEQGPGTHCDPAPVAAPVAAPPAAPLAAEPPILRTEIEISDALDSTASLISTLGLDDGFMPEEPRRLEETGLNKSMVDDLIHKALLAAGSLSGREIAERLCLPLAIVEDRFTELRRRQTLTPAGSAMLGDNVYELTEQGRERARRALDECAYSGPAPVPLDDYIDSVQAQTIRNEKPKRAQLEKAFSDINVEPEMLARLGPAISAGKGMFVYGPPGNGKTTIAQRITRCFGQSILVPYAIVEDGQIIKFFDASCHEPEEAKVSSMLMSSDGDRRWVRIRRPTVVVGGELTMDSLELKHDPVSHVSEASLQLKSNCGSLLIDDFGRQRVNPTELLNRWIIPLENRIDYLSLANGKKIEVPFEQLIIFSTNLEPHDLADDAFLRRIPFKIEIGAPSREEFIKLLGVFAAKLGVECPPVSIEYLLEQHYDRCARPLRRCQARDLLDQVAHYCEYNELPKVARREILDHAVSNYFTAMAGGE